jgi:hypothetical protein
VSAGPKGDAEVLCDKGAQGCLVGQASFDAAGDASVGPHQERHGCATRPLQRHPGLALGIED